MDNKLISKVVFDFDVNTRDLLRDIIRGSLMSSNCSGIPIDPKYYDAIRKLKTLSEFNGVMTIELPSKIVVDENYLKLNGVSEVI